MRNLRRQTLTNPVNRLFNAYSRTPYQRCLRSRQLRRLRHQPKYKIRSISKFLSTLRNLSMNINLSMRHSITRFHHGIARTKRSRVHFNPIRVIATRHNLKFSRRGQPIVINRRIQARLVNRRPPRGWNLTHVRITCSARTDLARDTPRNLNPNIQYIRNTNRHKVLTRFSLRDNKLNFHLHADHTKRQITLITMNHNHASFSNTFRTLHPKLLNQHSN